MAVVLAATAMPRDLAAMQFEPLSSDGDMGVVSGRGEIVQGDADRLRNALAVAPAVKRVALLLDSPGGSVREAAQMGRMIRDGTVTVVIPQNSKCVSACFLLLAGATRRFAATDALVGVHSASESGEETVNSLAVTTAMARAAADFGVPAGILGKMVRTVPGRVEWLTHDDLISMGVEILDENGSPRPAQHASSRPPPAASPSSAPTPTQPVAPAPFSRAPAFLFASISTRRHLARMKSDTSEGSLSSASGSQRICLLSRTF